MSDLNEWLTAPEPCQPAPPPYPYIVVIDEPGYGYAHPCYSMDEAMRVVRRLQGDGFRVLIKRIKP